MSTLSEKEYWDKTYESDQVSNIDISGFKNFGTREIYDSICSLDLADKNILEIGAGGSAWLTFLAKQCPSSAFTGLDYSKPGCEKLSERSKEAGVDVRVVHGDLFDPPGGLLGTFDVILSFGVVEHFDELDVVLAAFKRFLKPKGCIYTIIPNMAGLIGSMTKKYDRAVYDIHNPHDLNSLKQGHADANLELIRDGYVSSNDFAVLSSCVDMNNLAPENRRRRLSFLALTRFSKLIWFFESSVFVLPKTSYFSPYIYCVAKSQE